MAGDRDARSRAADESRDRGDLGAGPEGDKIRRGPDSSTSLKYSPRVAGWNGSTLFNSRRLNFIYQEQRGDGRQSNFFRLENPNREDA